MKLSNVFAKLTGGKVKVLSAVGGLAIAGMAMTAATPAAKAQVAFGVEVGGPRYYAPAPRPVYVAPGYGYAAPAYGYVAPGYWQQRRAEAWREHEWREHERFEHRAFDRDRRYDRDGWR